MSSAILPVGIQSTVWQFKNDPVIKRFMWAMGDIVSRASCSMVVQPDGRMELDIDKESKRLISQYRTMMEHYIATNYEHIKTLGIHLP